jgi:hypothetical protein
MRFCEHDNESPAFFPEERKIFRSAEQLSSLHKALEFLCYYEDNN